MKTNKLLFKLIIFLVFFSCKKDEAPSNSDINITPKWIYDEISDIEYAKISLNGKWAIVASEYKIALLDIINKTKLYELTLNENDLDFVRDVSISNEGYALVGTSNGIKVFSVNQGLLANFSSIYYQSMNIKVSSPAKISSSSIHYFVNGNMKFEIPNNLIWYNSIYNGDLVNPNYESSYDFDVSGDGEYIASASSIYNSPVLISGDGTLLWKSTYDNDVVQSIKISYDGSKIAVGTLSEISYYSKNSPNPIYIWHHNEFYARVAISSNGNIVAGGTGHGKLVIFNGGSGIPDVISDKPGGPVNDICISPDGNTIVLATNFGGLEIYDKNGNLKFQHDTQYSGSVGNVSISADGKKIGCVFQGKFHLYILP